MTLKKIGFSIAVLFFLISCTKEEDLVPGENISELRNETVKALTGEGEKVWRIEKAFLIPSGSSSNSRLHGRSDNYSENLRMVATQNQIDISSNFNVVDDEFEFTESFGGLSVTWKKGLDINTAGKTAEEALMDYAVSNELFSLNFQAESGTVVKSEEEDLWFEWKDNQLLQAEVRNLDGSKLIVELAEKKDEDYLSPPAGGLVFSKLFSFQGNCISGCAPGMIGSYRENSIYLASRDNENQINGVLPERVIQYQLKTGQLKDRFYPQRDFVSKQLHIVTDKLYVMGASGVNIYDLNLSSNPRRVLHGKSLSRFGMAVLDQDLYLVGGDLNEQELDKVFKWNIETEVLTEFAKLPEPKSGARATIVDDHLYFFGGSEKLFGTIGSDKIFKINLKNPSEIQTFRMQGKWEFTFVDKFQNLIYVAGVSEIRDPDFSIDSFVGVFDTRTNVFTELQTNLPKVGFSTIHGICVFNGKLYVLYDSIESPRTSWDVYEAELQ